MDIQKGINRNRLITIGGALICFAFVSYLVVNGQVSGFDDPLRNWFYALRGPLQNRILTAITYLGNKQTVVFICLALLVIPKTRVDIGLPLAGTAISSLIIYKAAKLTFMRPRPDEAFRIIAESGWSFPSGHTMNTLVIYGMLIYLIRRAYRDRELISKNVADIITAILTALIILIPLSRIYVGVHYPTDILGGWSLGLAVLMLAEIAVDGITLKISEMRRTENDENS